MSSISNNEIKFSEKENLNEIIKQLGSDYAKYAHVSVKNEKATLEEEVDDLLTRLDEFSSLLDMVRNDNALCLNNTLPEIYLKSREMDALYAKIDKLEHGINLIRRNLDIMEETVNEAEKTLENGTVKKLLSTFQKPLFSRKPTESKKSPKYEAPPIFSTQEIFNTSKDPEPQDLTNEDTDINETMD